MTEQILSQHTKLINALITLGHRTPDFKHPLEDIGYTIDFIGLRIVLQTGELRSDISFKSHKENTLVLMEAKSGGIEVKQAERYRTLSPNDISIRGLTSLPADNLKVQVCYVCTSGNHEKLLENEEKYHLGFPILVFNGTSLRKSREIKNVFVSEQLEELFDIGVTFDKELSNYYYPFGEGDNKAWIAFCILCTMAQFYGSGKKIFYEIELVRETHPLFEYISSDEKKSIRRTTRDVLDQLNKQDMVNFKIKRLEDQKWEIIDFRYTKSMQRFLMSVASIFETRAGYADIRDLLGIQSQTP